MPPSRLRPQPLALLLLSTCLASPKLTPAAEPFSFDSLKSRARSLASSPHTHPSDSLADFWKNLTYDQHRDIRFRMEDGLWARDKRPFSIDFFHPGWTAKKTVTIHEVRNGQADPLAFNRSIFDYGKNSIPDSVPAPNGYAGWRARCHLNGPDYMDEFLVFLGASYFRSIPANSPYGLSARGLSINSGLPNEEFPDFREFWLEPPTPDASSLRSWALLDGPSVSGAFQFTVTPGTETTIDIEAELTLRQPVTQLGLAPFSSMFWFGEATHPKPYDFRPEVHDSDGLLMELADGALHFRPLEQSKDRSRHCVFSLDKPRSWSLLQRDRSFASYLDTEARYHDRPSVRVEPLEGFNQGKLHLIELPATDETGDNVVLLWEPQPALQTGKPFTFRYRLHWMRDPQPSGLFTVKATRCGHPVQRPDQILVSIDFAKPLLPQPKEPHMKWDDITSLKPVVTANHPDVKIIHAGISDLSMAHVDDLPLKLGRRPDIHMPQVLRAFFVLEAPASLSETDLTCELRNADGHPVSEKWLWLWHRP
jgi:glucans biosynthesis protein